MTRLNLVTIAKVWSYENIVLKISLWNRPLLLVVKLQIKFCWNPT